MRNRTLVWKAAAVLAATLVVGACGGEPQARSITLTFVRNAQSQADADGIIDTNMPGPGLSQEGQEQAQQLVHKIVHKDVDSIYASGMADAQQTAQALASSVGKQVEVLEGLQPINAGWFNGKPQSMASTTYMLAPLDWVNHGDMRNGMPGTSCRQNSPVECNGVDFNEQFTRAVKKIYESNHSKPMVFTQGTAIMVWTLINVKNPKSTLLDTHPLPNGGRVVITGNPTNGWELKDWDGIHDFTS
jgi:broad specificity phosphatase PhoE